MKLREKKRNKIYSILIVEDEKIVALTLERLLEKRDFRVIGNVSSGEEALEILEDDQPDLILMDIMLDGELDGIETADRIAQQHDLPVIYLTANADETTIDRAKYTRPYGYIVKPFDQKDIYRTVDMALYKHEMEKKIRDMESKNRAILEAIPDYIFKVNSKGIIQDVKVPPNAEFPFPESFFVNCTLEHMFRKSKRIPMHIADSIMELVERSIKNEVLEIYEFDIENEGDRLYFETRIIRLDEELVLIMVRDVTDKKNTEARILNTIVQTQEMERKRFATDLHDSLGQVLSAIKMNLGSINPEAMSMPESKRKVLERTKTMLDDAVRETRNISHSLMSTTLSEFGIEFALGDLCRKIENPQLLKINFSSFGEIGRFEEVIEISLYRVCQELFNNIIKHSKAKDVDVQLVLHNESLVLTVEDNGIGFDKDKIQLKSGIGLSNIESRVTMMQGKCTFDSMPGKGTTVTIEVPIRNTNASLSTKAEAG